MYIVEYLSKYFIKQMQVKSNQNTSSCREWNVVLFVPELKVTGKPMIDGQNHFFAEGLWYLMSQISAGCIRDIMICLKCAGRYNLEGDFFGVELGKSEGPET